MNHSKEDPAKEKALVGARYSLILVVAGFAIPNAMTFLVPHEYLSGLAVSLLLVGLVLSLRSLRYWQAKLAFALFWLVPIVFMVSNILLSDSPSSFWQVSNFLYWTQHTG